MKATVEMLNGEKRRLTLPNPVWEGNVSQGLGVKLTGLYIGRRTHRVVMRVYSIWSSGLVVEGERFIECMDSQIADFCNEFKEFAEVWDNLGAPEEL
jgi:transketolase N-terminal domain/subunit